MVWNYKIIYRMPKGGFRYEWVSGEDVIDVSIGSEQGFAGSNQVNVFASHYGGWSLDTPKNFRTVKEVDAFVVFAKKQLDKKVYGKQVPFPR